VIRNAFEEVKSVVAARSVPFFELSCRRFPGNDEIEMLLLQDFGFSNVYIELSHGAL
jgi:hypothetical protein